LTKFEKCVVVKGGLTKAKKNDKIFGAGQKQKFLCKRTQ
jgi:hypothetical protein